jgi:hypothetical protein
MSSTQWPAWVTASSEHWQWEIDPFTLRRMAQATLGLFMQPERWIHRRVERVYFKDHHLAHHQVSVDFTLPAGLPPIGSFAGADIFVAPLFLLIKGSPKPLREGKLARRRHWLFGERKADPTKQRIPTAPYSSIDLTDQGGNTLPLLSRKQSGLLTGTMLLEAAEQIIGAPPDEELTSQLTAIASRSWSDLTEVLCWLLTAPLQDTTDPRSLLREETPFTELVYTLASHSLVICLFLHGPPGRSVYKLAYDEPSNDHVPQPKGAIRRSLGWKSEQYFVSLNEIGGSASYHAEIAVPEELEITAVNLFGKRYARYGSMLTDEGRDYAIQQIGIANEGKIYIPEPLPGRRVGMAWVKLRARRSGFLGGALLSSLLTTVLLGLGAYGAPYVVRGTKSEPAAAALLLVPAVLAAYIVRPGEHAITRKMLRWVRVFLLGNALLAALAVFFLIITPDMSVTEPLGNASLGPLRLALSVTRQAASAGSGLRFWWTILAAISFVCSVVLSISNILPFAHGETVYEPMPRETTES